MISTMMDGRLLAEKRGIPRLEPRWGSRGALLLLLPSWWDGIRLLPKLLCEPPPRRHQEGCATHHLCVWRLQHCLALGVVCTSCCRSAIFGGKTAAHTKEHCRSSSGSLCWQQPLGCNCLLWCPTAARHLLLLWLLKWWVLPCLLLALLPPLHRLYVSSVTYTGSTARSSRRSRCCDRMQLSSYCTGPSRKPCCCSCWDIQ